MNPQGYPTRTSNVRVCQFRHPRITSRGAGLGAAGELLDYNSTTGPQVKPGNHILWAFIQKPGRHILYCIPLQTGGFYAAILPYTPGRGALAAAGRRQRRRRLCPGGGGQPAPPLSARRPSSLPRPPPASLRRAGARAAPPSPARPRPASQAELPPLVCLTFDDGPSRTTPPSWRPWRRRRCPPPFLWWPTRTTRATCP